MAGPVFNPIEIIRIFSHVFKNSTKNINVAFFPIGTDKVRLAQTTLLQDGPYGA